MNKDLIGYKTQYFDNSVHKLYPDIPDILTPKIYLEAKEYVGIFASVQQGLGRDYIDFKNKDKSVTFVFNAPSELVETITNNYEDYDSVIQNIKEGVSRVMYETIKSVEHLENVIQPTRVDSPLAYSKTENRDMNFVFEVPLFNSVDDTERALKILKTVVLPSAADNKVSSGIIEPPALFSIYMEDGFNKSNLIYMRRAVCRTFQITYKKPYIRGVPSICQIDMQFTELDPPFDHNTKKRNIVTTTSGSPPVDNTKPTTPSVIKEHNITETDYNNGNPPVITQQGDSPLVRDVKKLLKFLNKKVGNE